MKSHVVYLLFTDVKNYLSSYIGRKGWTDGRMDGADGEEAY